MTLVTILKIANIIATLLLGSIVIWDTIQLYKLKRIIVIQDELIDFQHHLIRYFKPSNNSIKETNSKKPISCAFIMKELEK